MILKGLDSKIGGLNDELKTIVRRVLLSRQVEPKVLKSLGLSHVRGLLLYGPPGCGKTLIARELASLLNARKPKIVNGPELLNKYLGESERNLRDLFQDAKQEWEDRGVQSDLHVVVFDELDAIARVRGGGGGDGDRTGDSCVNQLLTLLDGISEMSNILVIGLTNRLDLIDPALLRPGRLEVHIKVTAPDFDGRKDVLRLLLAPLFEAGYIQTDATGLQTMIDDISFNTEGFSGAELTGLTRNAASFALERVSEEHLSVTNNFMNHFKILKVDFDNALQADLRRARDI
jgi:vesicle-fusing ATPase